MVVSSCRDFGLSLDAMTCLSRNDSNKDIFQKVNKPQKNKRRNFFNMVDIDVKKRMLVCQDESYSLDDVCVFGSWDESKKCTLRNTNKEVAELNYRR